MKSRLGAPPAPPSGSAARTSARGGRSRPRDAPGAAGRRAPRVDPLEGEVGANRGGLYLLVQRAGPGAGAWSQRLAQRSGSAVGAPPCGRGSHAHVGDPVHEPMLWIEDGGPVAAQALDEAAREGILEALRLGHEAGHRARPMGEVGLPRSQAVAARTQDPRSDLASSDAHLLPPLDAHRASAVRQVSGYAWYPSLDKILVSVEDLALVTRLEEHNEMTVSSNPKSEAGTLSEPQGGRVARR